MASDKNLTASDEPTLDMPGQTAASDGEPTPSGKGEEGAQQRVGPFLLLELLGRGGMGEVHRAVHVKLKKTVALKLLPAERAADQQAMSRFRREVQVISGLSHPNIVRFENAGEADGVPYLVMEYVRGVDLERLVRRLGPLNVPDACQLVGQAAVGLQHAHQAGLVHRDVKPANLMLASTAIVKLLDLGVALLAEPSWETLTSPDQVIGNLECLAPEQARHSHTVDARADVYALGCTLFKLLTGQAPFPLQRYGSAQAVVQAHLNESPPEAFRFCPHVPKELSAALTRMMAKDPAHRYPSAAHAACELARWAEGCDLPALLARAELAHEPAEMAGLAQATTVDYLKSALAETTIDREAAVPGGRTMESNAVPDSQKRRTRGMLNAAAGAVVLLGLISWMFLRTSREPPAFSQIPTTEVIDWSAVAWPDRTVTKREYSFEDIRATIEIQGYSPHAATRDWPDDNTSLHGGLEPPQESLLLPLPGERADERTTVRIAFSEPVKEVAFTLFDVDASQGGKDQVEVRGRSGGLAVEPSTTTGAANHSEPGTGIIAGQSFCEDQGPNSGAGNVAVRFEQPLDEISLEYRRTGTDVVGTRHGIGLHDIQFTRAKPICNNCTLDWDRVDWCRADRHRLTVGGVDMAVSFSGDAVRPTGSVRPDVAPAALIWRAEWRSVHQSATATFDFAHPVKDVAFPIHGLAASYGGIQDEIAVLGFRRGQPVDGPRLEVSASGRSSTREIIPKVDVPTVYGTSRQDRAAVQVRFDKVIDRFVLRLSPNAPGAGNDQALPGSPSRGKTAKPFPHVSELSLGNVRFTPADQDAAREFPDGTSARTTVPATANPWTAGLAWDQLAAEEIPTDQRAVRIDGLALNERTALTFSVGGSVREQSGMIARTADGGRPVQNQGGPKYGIPAAEAPAGSLVGVFLGQPKSADAGVGTISARFGSAIADEIIAPALKEVFLIGDGKSPDGKPQQFLVPAGASELYLGIMDDQRWQDNVGWLCVEVSTRPAPATVQPPAPVDLLAPVSPARDALVGEVRREDRALVVDAGSDGSAMLQIPFYAPAHGEVTLAVERRGGAGSLGVGLAAGHARFVAFLDAPTEKGPASVISHHGPNGPLSTNTSYVQRLPMAVPLQVNISVSTDLISVSCGNELITQCVCPHASLRTAGNLESSYPHAIFLVARGGTFRITQLTLAPRDGVAEPIRFSEADQAPQRAAAELAIWKGASAQLVADDQAARSIVHLRDLPAQPTLVGIGLRAGRQGTTLNDSDLAILGRARQLQHLDLSRSRVTNAGLAHMAGLTQLRTLDLSRTAVSGEGLAELSRLEQLETLRLENTTIGDADLPALYKLRRLKHLCLNGTKVSAEGSNELRRHLPSTIVHTQDPSAAGSAPTSEP